MTWIVPNLWLIPALPLLAAGIAALLPRTQARAASALAIGSMLGAFVLSVIALVHTLGEPARSVFNFSWFELGATTFRLGWLLDPLTAAMLVMVTFVGTLIFIFSTGYMAHDANRKQFFCFLSLFAAAMLGLLIANNLLFLFMCWELVGLASYLLIGFWFHKPSAAAAAKKAFLTTRIGDIFFFLGIVWLYHVAGTLLFYDNGQGCLEFATHALGGFPALGAIALLLFAGAVGKSGQFPLHVWLPDAMEGPTPVSALIHAATMVAAGVFLIARIYPLMEAPVAGVEHAAPSLALQVITWVGAFTAIFAALIAVAQTDIKRILAYSTVSQLGYMFLGLGTGGVAVGMFHLLTHAFFKALLFLGSGSVIHGCHEEQDIRRMGGLKKFMPVTFVTYGLGMMALAGVVPLAGFWSKDEILHSALHWPNKIPFALGLGGAFLTAFYMTRQMCYVFFGEYRGAKSSASEHHGEDHDHDHHAHTPHESPAVMTVPLAILAVCAVTLGFFGTPAWPWFDAYINGHHATFDFSRLLTPSALGLMGTSIAVVAAGIGLGWWIYARRTDEALDPIEKAQPVVFRVLQNKFYMDELYAATVLRLHRALGIFSDWLDRAIWSGAVRLASGLMLGLAWFNRRVDEDVVNLGFDHACEEVRESSRFFSKLQDGQVQNYLRVIGVALVALLLVLYWGGGR